MQLQTPSFSFSMHCNVQLRNSLPSRPSLAMETLSRSYSRQAELSAKPRSAPRERKRVAFSPQGTSSTCNRASRLATQATMQDSSDKVVVRAPLREQDDSIGKEERRADVKVVLVSPQVSRRSFAVTLPGGDILSIVLHVLCSDTS